MIENAKPVDSLTVADLVADPVWEFADGDEAGETLVRPVKTLPVRDLTGELVGTQVCFGNGTTAWALIGNVDTRNPRRTEHFLTLSIERSGTWLGLARYHDFDYADRGPEALARFLDLRVEDVFPISFDIRRYAQGDPAALAGSVQQEPRERLSRAELVAMAVP